VMRGIPPKLCPRVFETMGSRASVAGRRTAGAIATRSGLISATLIGQRSAG